MVTARVLVLSLAAAPWSCSPASSPTQASQSEPEASAPVDAPPSALKSARDSVTAHMPEHLERARAIHDAVILGKLPDARAEAKWIAEHWPEQILETWVPFVRDLRSAGARLEVADEIDGAARATAAVAAACGQCHEALADGPDFAAPPDPVDEPGAEALMRRHRWAADRLWEGVIQASEERWKQGVSALAQMPACQEDHGGEQLIEAIEAARAKTEEARVRAQTASSSEGRARVYGDLLATCSTCHLAGC